MKIKRIFKQLFTRGQVKTRLPNSSSPLIRGGNGASAWSWEYGWIHGILLIIFSVFGDSMMYFFIHVSANQYGLPAGSVATVYFVVSALFALFYICTRLGVKKIPFSLRKWVTLAFHGGVNSCSGFVFFMALRRLPVGVAATAYYSYPVIAMLIFSVLLRHRIGLFDFIIALVCIAGLTVISLPDVFQNTSLDNPLSISFGRAELGSLYAIAAAVFRAVFYYVTRSFETRVHFAFLSLSYSIGLAVIGFFFGSFGDLWELLLNRKGLVAAVIGSVFGFFGQAMESSGLERVPSGPAFLVRGLTIPLSFFLGVVFLKENVTFPTLVGAALIATASAIVGTFWKNGRS